MSTTNNTVPPRPGDYHRVALAAHALIYNAEGSLLVIRRDGTDYLDGYWTVPAGHVEEVETAVQACVREVYEEVGLTLTADELEFLLVQQKSGEDGEERIDFFFRADWHGFDQPHINAPYELDSIAWADPSELPEPFAPYVCSALARIDAGALIAYWGL